MKLIKGRKKLYDGEVTSEESFYGMSFMICDHTFESDKILNSERKFTDLALQLPNPDFLQVIASGFETTDNFIFGGKYYRSPDGLTLTYELRDNLLYVFSYGEFQPGRYFLYSEGVWELSSEPETAKSDYRLNPEDELRRIETAFACFFAVHHFKLKSSRLDRIVFENDYSELIFDFDGYGLRFGYMSPATVLYRDKINDRIYSIREIMAKLLCLDFKIIFEDYFEKRRLEYYESLKEIIEKYLSDIFSDADFSWTENFGKNGDKLV